MFFSLPASATEEPAEALPRVEVSSLKGARVGLRRGFVDEEAGLGFRAACVEAPSDRFAPGVEEIVLGMATSIARNAASDGVTIERWDAEGITRHEGRFEQAFTGRGTGGDRPVTFRGRHVLGFEGEASEAFKAQLEKGVLFPKRLGDPDELASMVLEAVTNSYLNAETIRVDGGIRMQPK